MLITGTKSDLTRILEAQDRAAYLPLPSSVYRHGQRINVCPECMRPITPHKFEDYKAGSLAPWQCSECGWVAGQATRTTCVESLCTAVLVDGILVGQVCDDVAEEMSRAGESLGKVSAYEVPKPPKESIPIIDDPFDLEPPTKPQPPFRL